MRIDADDVIAQAANNLRRAMGVAQLLETLALFVLVVGGLSVVATVFAVAGDDSIDPGIAIASAVMAIVVSLAIYALFRGLASIITLMVDRVLVEAEADDGDD